jgi:hypothetical protein
MVQVGEQSEELLAGEGDLWPWDLAKIIQARFPCVPMIAMSGYINESSTAVTETLRGIGVREVLRKPFDPLYLGAAVNHVPDPQG